MTLHSYPEGQGSVLPFVASKAARLRQNKQAALTRCLHYSGAW
jgi:hypothetical protein